MQFIKTAGWEDGIADLTKHLVTELRADKRVLWLVSGGSNINATVQIMDSISEDLSQKLTIAAIDERYGPEGHVDSNWGQLQQRGFDSKQAVTIPVLHDGEALADTVSRYEESLQAAWQTTDTVIAQLGIGEDGHIAGILPHSLATQDTDRLLVGYESEPFTRITMTFAALKQVQVAYVFAFGSNKYHALRDLQEKDLELAMEPAQVLKTIPEVYIYNDQIGVEA